MNICDKCGKTIEKKDSATWLAVEAGEMDGLGLFVFRDRHIQCSPSRAQFVIGLDIVDDRPEYDKRLLSVEARVNRENRWTNAFNKLQEENV